MSEEVHSGLPRAGDIAAGSGDDPAAPPAARPDDAGALIELAIESVLEQVPGTAEEPLEDSPTYQPWAEIAAPPSKNKRPLEQLLAEYAERVAADPHARAGHPSGRHPVAAFFDRFGQPRREREPGGEGGRRRRRGRGERRQQPAPAPDGQRQRGGRGRHPAPTAPAQAPPQGRRRRTRHRRRGGGAGAPSPPT